MNRPHALAYLYAAARRPDHRAVRSAPGAAVIQSAATNVSLGMHAVVHDQNVRSTPSFRHPAGAPRRVTGARSPARAPVFAANPLIEAIAERGDRAAFASLFGHFAPRVKSYMMRLGAAPEAAEELAQEALLTVWRRAAAFDPQRAAASTWIFTIARNLRIDLARREGRPARPEDPSEAASPPAHPDDIVAGAEDCARIAAAMAALPVEQIEVIRHAFFSDQPHSEIAAALELPLGTVKSRLRLALARLRIALRDAA
ncbi:MAG TPA: sigma-70 family RNA polymerase sigma factor [Caulobacteraceae bacterium]|nr:sigma-70 family RNA polymerase sigma factor [Caulobacteraceae bacterium]